MINANELRIGNWLLMGDHTFVKVNELRKKEIFLNTEVALIECYYNDTNPIDLSPEILEACGFEKVGEYHPEGITMLIRNGVFEITWISAYKYGYINGKLLPTESLKYLHQLQNLYFALTGSELMIDEQKLQRSLSKSKMIQ